MWWFAKKDKKIKDAYSYFVTAERHAALSIEKFHLCSWLYRKFLFWRREVLEIGLQIKVKSEEGLGRLEDGSRVLEVSVLVPWLSDKAKVEDLYPSIRDTKNARFIFNEDVEPGRTFDCGEGDAGQVLEFAHPICALPVDRRVANGVLHLAVRIPDEMDIKLWSVYVRVAMRIPNGKYYYAAHGLSRSLYSFDVKVNEPRNFPDPAHKACICSIENCFSINILPSDFQVVFLSPETFKNVRILEHEMYNHYVKGRESFIQNIKPNKYQVVFNRKDKDHFSFFSVFESEHIGLTPLIITVLLNIACTILFLSTKTYEESLLCSCFRAIKNCFSGWF